MLKAKKGFTLIELLIVIVIIGILAGIVVGIVGTSARKKANDTRKKADFHEIQNALEQYFVDKDYYPVDLAALNPDYLKTTIAEMEDQSGNKTYNYDPTEDANDATKATAYRLTVELENQNDSGSNVDINVDPKVYYIESKQ